MPLLESLPASMTWDFAASVLSIVLIDLVLAGDNAVVIAMAVRNLPPRQRLVGTVLGAGGAVAMRVVLTFFASQLLDLPYLKLVGGLLIAWIAVKLLKEGAPEDASHRECATLFQAVTTVLLADLVMSVDNVLAVAGASKGSLGLLLFGLGLSIPLVVFTSGLLSRLMDRFPIIVYLGSAILGKVAGEMIFTDPAVVVRLAPSRTAVHLAEVVGIVVVVALGWLWMKLNARRGVVAQPCPVEEVTERPPD